MKWKLKSLIAAVGFALAGQAGAAITTGTSSNSLFLTVWDDTAGIQQSYTRNLGTLFDSFLLGTAPAVTTVFGGDSLFSSTFGASSSANLRWNIVGGDSLVDGTDRQQVMTTHVLSTMAGGVTNGAVSNAAPNTDTFANAMNGLGCTANNSCVNNVPGSLGYGAAATWDTDFGNAIASVNNVGLGGAAQLFFWLLTSTSSNNFGAATKQKYGNGFGDSYWTLNASTGAVTWNVASPAAVPVPAAAWLLGSGLLGLVGVARRRKQQDIQGLAAA